MRARGWIPKRKLFPPASQGLSTGIGVSLTSNLNQRNEGVLTRPQLNLPLSEDLISSELIVIIVSVFFILLLLLLLSIYYFYFNYYY